MRMRNRIMLAAAVASGAVLAAGLTIAPASADPGDDRHGLMVLLQHV